MLPAGVYVSTISFAVPWDLPRANSIRAKRQHPRMAAEWSQARSLWRQRSLPPQAEGLHCPFRRERFSGGKHQLASQGSSAPGLSAQRPRGEQRTPGPLHLNFRALAPCKRRAPRAERRGTLFVRREKEQGLP
jgi:hypothetical protein